MSKTDKTKRVLTTVVTVLLVALVILNVYLLVGRTVFCNPLPRIFGYTGAVVLSGSMSDAINANDLVLVHEQDTYNVDDVVTYLGTGSTPVTHRIIEKTPTGYVTQGDANNTPDPEIAENQVVGRVVFVVPWIGTLRTIFASPLMISFILGFIALYIFWRSRQSLETPKED